MIFWILTPYPPPPPATRVPLLGGGWEGVGGSKLLCVLWPLCVYLDLFVFGWPYNEHHRHTQGYAFAKTLASLASGLPLAVASEFPIIPERVTVGVVLGQWRVGTVWWNYGELWGIMVQPWAIIGNYGTIMVHPWGIMGEFGELWGIMGNYGEFCCCC